jgi:chemotaxis protein methyltransferase CheR
MDTRNVGLNNSDFDRLRTLVYRESGINLSSDKKTMMEIRIKRRLRSIGISSFGQYCDHVFAPEGRESELVNLIDVITTNKTDFFSEAGHFEYLVSKALPDLAAQK